MTPLTTHHALEKLTEWNKPVSRDLLLLHLRKGHLPSTRFGRNYAIEETDLLKWVDEQAAKHRTGPKLGSKRGKK